MSQAITVAQLKSLQTLFGMYAARFLFFTDADERSARLAWASQNVGRPISSFKELRSDEAAQLIDLAKRALGQQVTPPRRKRLTREAAQARGAHGRRGHKEKVQVMATAEDLAEIDRLRERAGISQDHFETWLRSRSSPLRGRADVRLLTVSDCNRVRWALGAMLRRAAEGKGEAAPEESAVKAS